MTNPAFFPGIGPLMSYRYDMARAAPRSAELGPVNGTDPWMWFHLSRIITAQVLWGIFKFERTGFPGRLCTVEGGILMFPMYDFCGGSVASSGFVRVHAEASGSEANIYRLYMPGCNETGTLKYTQCCSPDFLQKVHVFPEISAYTGKPTHTLDEAHDFMQRSIASSLVTLMQQQRRRGLWGADHWGGERGQTRAILSKMHGVVPYYMALPGVVYWQGQLVHGSLWPQTEIRGGVGHIAWHELEYDAGRRYTNDNSGNQVSMASVHSVKATRSQGAFGVTAPESTKFINAELHSMCPQALFHN